MKGIITAGGSGSRWLPLAAAVNKHLYPVFDKPMFYYPLALLMSLKIREILIVVSPISLQPIKELLKDSSELGLEIHYLVQEQANGIADILILSEEFLKKSSCVLALGDNLFYHQSLPAMLSPAFDSCGGAVLVCHETDTPSSVAVAYFDSSGFITDVVEKPFHKEAEKIAVTGLYAYDSSACEYARTLRPSSRGELEITDLNRIYVRRRQAQTVCLPNSVYWKDLGAPGALLHAGNFVAEQAKQGIFIGCIEAQALENGWIDGDTLLKRAHRYKNTAYGEHLNSLAMEL